MIYFLTNTLFFGSKVAEIVEADKLGFFLISKDLPGGTNLKKHLPKPFIDLCPLIFSIEDSGKTQIFDGSWKPAYNGIYALLEVYFETLETPNSNQLIDSLTNLTSVCSETGINLKRCLSRDLKALVLADRQELADSTDFIGDWVKGSPTYSALASSINSTEVVLMPDSRFPTGLRKELEVMEGKGEFGERCNVTACQTPGQAFFWNLGTRAYYCIHCAVDIRRSNLMDGDLFPELASYRRRNTTVAISDLKLPGTDRGEFVWK
jgi:hypothetical protein